MNGKLYMLKTRRYDGGSQTFLEITREEQTIHHSEIDQLSAKMIQSNQIPLLVPLEIEEINLEVTFHYNITGHHTLGDYLKQRRLSLKEFYELLLKIVSKIEDSREYLLHEEKFIIHEDYIFVKNNLDEMFLMYVPLTEITQKTQIQYEFRQMMLNILGRITDLRGNGFQELINYLGSGEFSLERFRSMLVSYLNDVDNVPYSSQHQSIQPVDVFPVEVTPHQEFSMPEKKVKKKAEKPKKEKAQKIQNNTQTEVVKEGTPQKVKLYSILGAILIIGIIWKMYLGAPSEGAMFISIGASILVADIVFIILAIIKPFGTIVTELETTMDTNDKKTASKKSGGKKKTSQQKDAMPREIEVHKEQPVYRNSADYYQQLENQTTLLSNPNTTIEDEVAATMLLSDISQEQRNYPFIEVDVNGKFEKVVIKKSSFVIGRSPESCDYVVQTVGISRRHFEILPLGDGYGLRDLQSSNGTRLNGEKLIANQLYPLKDHDIIAFAKETATFRKE